MLWQLEFAPYICRSDASQKVLVEPQANKPGSAAQTKAASQPQENAEEEGTEEDWLQFLTDEVLVLTILQERCHALQQVSKILPTAAKQSIF